MATKKTKPMRMNQTAAQYNKELIFILKISKKDAITLDFLKQSQKILQKKGGIIFGRELATPIHKKK